MSSVCVDHSNRGPVKKKEKEEKCGTVPMAHIVGAFGKECVQNNVRSKNFGSKHLKPKKNLDTKRFLVQKNISNKKFVKQMIQKVSDEKFFSRKNKNYMDFIINKLNRIGPRQCMNLFHTTSKFSIS